MTVWCAIPPTFPPGTSPDWTSPSGPHLALDGGTDGLDFYRSVCRRWRDVLHTGSRLAFEVGIGQADDVLRLMRGEGFGELEILPDPAGIPRVVTGLRYRGVYADA